MRTMTAVIAVSFGTFQDEGDQLGPEALPCGGRRQAVASGGRRNGASGTGAGLDGACGAVGGPRWVFNAAPLAGRIGEFGIVGIDPVVRAVVALREASVQFVFASAELSTKFGKSMSSRRRAAPLNEGPWETSELRVDTSSAEDV